MAYEAHIAKINDSYYIVELIPKPSSPDASLTALFVFALLLVVGLTVYVYNREYKLNKENTELRKRLVTVLERLEKKLGEK